MPSNKSLRYLLLATLLVTGSIYGISGCATRHIPNNFTFTTHINEQGFKLFQLSFPARQREISVNASNPDIRTRNADDYQERYLERMLEVAIEQSEYCHQGFLQLGRYAGETSERLRGECREKATDADRARFPNTLSHW